MATPRILVVGSINVDIVALTDRLPTPGETVTGGTLLINHGGKGANQAVAARRLGADVRFIGCVGDDTFGPELRQGMAAEGIGVAGLATIPGINSGTGLIVVDAAGRNQIAVASGANLRLTVDWIAQFADDFAWPQVVICQLEVPLETVLWTLRTARQHGAITILNPAPAQPLPSSLWPLVDYLTPNEVEAAHLSGLPLATPHEAGPVAQALLAQGPRVVILTLGAQGAFVGTLAAGEHIPAFPVQPVDTTAAGDAFNGALAVALAEGCTHSAAVRFANAAAGLACTQPGAQNSLPRREQVTAMLETLPV
ncbi:MAG: ribokinase [Candidatus Tectomicrobia bacterium]|uniref:Ribokinase n=1 Tax=Tectimicrobiota bacterium TaxID=2528274 RepID=A0A937VXT8_UNCTE|nr:ribokinase [Candidatus Tectomicrobia bacterium]